MERIRSDQFDVRREEMMQRFANPSKQPVLLALVLRRTGEKLGKQLDERAEDEVIVDIFQRSLNPLQQGLRVLV